MAAGNSLSDTVLEPVYTIFGVSTDEDLYRKMINITYLYVLAANIACSFLPLPYGRYFRFVIGPTINAKLGFMIFISGSFVAPLMIITLTPCLQLSNFANALALGLFMLHYFQRSFIYPVTLSNHAKRMTMPFVILGPVAAAFHGLLQGHHLANVRKVDNSFFVYIGVVYFLTGMAINIYHDQILIALRKTAAKRESTPQKTDYKIPRGGLFSYISCANYFGEIVEWVGLAMITRQSPQVTFAVFTAIFLGIRALHHHRFYKDKFGSTYPTARKAIIPFIL